MGPSFFDFSWKLLILVSLSSTFIFGAFNVVQPLLKRFSGRYFKKWSQASLLVFLGLISIFSILLMTVDRDLQMECFKRFADSQDAFGLTRLVAFVWILGIGGFGVLDIFRYQTLKKRVAENILRVDRDYSIVSNNLTPLTFGFFKSTVVIPEYLLADMELLQYVVAHERVHANNRDGVWNFLMLISLRLCWFNPLVWLFSKYRTLAVEMATDEEAIAINEFSSTEYGSALINLLKSQQSFPPQLSFMGMSSDFFQMRERLENLNPRKKRTMKTRYKSLVALAMTTAWFVGLEQSFASIQLERPKTAGELMCYQVQHEKVIESWLKVQTETNKCE